MRAAGIEDDDVDGVGRLVILEIISSYQYVKPNEERRGLFESLLDDSSSELLIAPEKQSSIRNRARSD